MTDTALTRRRSENSHQETWHIYFGVHVGTIGTRAGVPKDVDQWGWHLGFYPGTEPGTHQSGSAESYPAARAEFERAWLQLEPTLTEENFETWRRSRDWHAWKYRISGNGCRMPTQNTSGWSKCFCGEQTPIACEAHIYSAHRGIGA
ncbi:hypothetical protein J4G43_038120 [Bradyrhizobium barranii subsp. barranii]|uniref:Uncharacterized protein n=1 Tax=Bradyrhizobium barranii subsp. barranii TaxID=2823807 RepID=A0A939MBM0_9BRAD|nr:hypothetical protein [Bradyrhizobium barranii]UEM10428.1 hypothetical protein J4G43_038120 [Bradyrhizobium barranii subsp. barranii]